MIYVMSLYDRYFPDDMKPRAAQAGPAPEASLKDMIDLFRENELRAQSKYADRRWKVSGVYRENGISLGAPWLLVYPEEYGGLRGAQCFLDRGSVGAAGRLEKGAKITMSGKVTGRTIYVSFMDCRIH